DAPQGIVPVVVILELLQRRQQRVPPTLGYTDCEHDEERIQPGLLDDHAVLDQITRNDCSRNAALGKAPGHVKSGRDDRCLDRVEHVEAGRQIAKAVPLLARAQYPILTRTDAVLGDFLRAPDTEPPVLAKFGIDLTHGTTEVERFDD